MIVSMKKTLIFIDTETTGIGAEDRLCQLAFIAKENGEITETYNELFNPGMKIPPDASAVTHITNKMVEGKPAFKSSDEYSRLKELLEKDSSVFVAHNAKFDIGMLAKENITVPSSAHFALRGILIPMEKFQNTTCSFCATSSRWKLMLLRTTHLVM